jgi:uncharacterized membrane protein YbhN (UPF0104 family)
LALGLGVIAFAIALRQANLGLAVAAITHCGPLLILALVPYLLVIALDTFVWRWLLSLLDRSVGFVGLLLVRLSAEAVLLSMPVGPVMAESLKAYLVGRRYQVPTGEAVATLGFKKSLLMFANGLYLFLAALSAFFLARARTETTGRVVGVVLLFLAFVLGGVALLFIKAFAGGSLGGRLHGLLARVPLAAFRRWLARNESAFRHTDTQLAALGMLSWPRLLQGALPFLVGWLLEAVETGFILWLLGAHVSPFQVLVIEAASAFARNAAFVVPAGLGAQDLGYLGLMAIYGIPGAGTICGAFILIKRAKELCWIGIGYLVLLVGGLGRGQVVAELRSSAGADS